MRPEQLHLIAHDPAALEAFYRENFDALQRFLARRLGDPQRVADFTADVFLAAIDGAASYQGRSEPRAWLFGIARNLVHAEYRRAKRERSANTQLHGRPPLDSDELARLQEQIDAAARSRELYVALEGLPEGERAVFELHALDDLSPREAAAVLGINPVTARVRLHRARRVLRTELFPACTDSVPTSSVEA